MHVETMTHNETSSLRELLDEVMVTAQVEAHRKNQVLQVQVGPDLEVDAGNDLLVDALMSLVQNAIKFTSPGGTIKVRADSVGKQTVIEVEDECGGLISAAPSYVFRLFEQHNINRDASALGLKNAQRIVALSGGVIDVKNHPGKGCIFRIRLPSPERMR